MEKNGVFLTNRQISVVASMLILVSFFVFVSGYFFGKKKTVDKFYNKVNQESLADHVFYSVCSNYGNENLDERQESTEDGQCNLKEQDQPGQELENNSLENNGDKNNLIKNSSVEKLSQSQQTCVETGIQIVNNDKQDKTLNLDEMSGQNSGDSVTDVSEQAQKDQFYAELVGFGSKIKADAFYNRLQKYGINVVLKKRKSKTSRGKTIFWYQAVTEKFDNKSDLVAFIDIIKGKENLKGIKIIQC